MKRATECGNCRNRRNIGRLCLFLIGSLGLHAEALLAAAGDLDPGFGDNGRVQLPFDGGLDWYASASGLAIVEQPDGRVLVARADQGSDGNAPVVAVARLLPDGTLDPEFGAGGVTQLQFRAGEAAGVNGLALLPDGRLVVVGYSVIGWTDGGWHGSPVLDTGLALVRSDGSLDPDGFGNGGRVTLDVSAPGRSDQAIAAVVLPDGSIIVAGTAESATSTRFFMAKMTVQGSLDPAFGERDGFAWSGSITQLRALHQTASGQFVACGTGMAGALQEGRIVRFDAAGDFVGETSLASARINYVTACAPQTDGGIVVGGTGSDGGWLARVNADGQIDMTFGDEWGRTFIACNSCAVWDRIGYNSAPTDIAVSTDGRLTVAVDGNGWGHLGMLSFAPQGRTESESPRWLTDRYFDTGWGSLPPSASVSRLWTTQEGDRLAVVAGLANTTVLRLRGSDGPGASVIGLSGDFTQQFESDSRDLFACRSGSVEGAVTVNFATRDGTARSPDDYVAASGVLAWGDGESGCKEIAIVVRVDDQAEPTESLWVELTAPANAGLAMDKAQLHIADVQAPASPPPAPPAPEPTPPSQGGGGAAGSALLALLLLCRLRRVAQMRIAGPQLAMAWLRGAIVACLATVTVLTTAAGPVFANELVFDRSQVPAELVGTWRVTTTPYQCVTGAAFPQFARMSLLTVGAGGTVVDGSSSPDFQPGQRSSGHGFWERTGRQSFRVVYEAFIIFTSVVTPPALPRYVRGTQRFDHGIEMIDADHWSSQASVTFFDVAGTPVPPTGCATAVAERMQ